MEPSFQARQTAIALNNIAVSLLERGAYKQASTTFKDSIAVLRSFFFAPNPASGEMLSYERIMLRAMKALIDAPTGKASFFSVQPLSHREDDLFVMKSIVSYGPSPSMLFPIRVDSNDEFHIDLLSATLLYNYGLSHLCVTRRMAHNSKARSKILNSARKVFDFAQTVLSNVTLDDDSFEQFPVLCFVAGMVMNSLAQILREQGRINEAADAS